MKMTTYKRILSALLAVVLLLSYVPGSVFAQTGEEFRIVSKTRSAGTLCFFENEKIVISVAGIPEGGQLQWQIAMPDGEGWVDIMGQEETELTLSYALIANVMDEAGCTSIRCTAEANGEMHTTSAITVQVLPEEEPIAAEPLQAVEETTIPTEETTIPTEETTAPTEETTIPTEETTAPTEETTIPTEGTTAPTEETTIPTEETTVPSEETTIPTEEIIIPTEETTIPIEGTTAPTEMTTEPRIADNNGMRSSASAVPTFVTVTIKYLVDKKGDNVLSELADPYVANIEKGTDLVINEKNPTYPGYAPYVNGVKLEGNFYQRTLTAAETQQDITIEIIYERELVKYAARYYLQNIGNDLYTEAAGYYEEFWGYAGDTPSKDAIDKPITGFSSLFHEPDEIAADGSTVFECYYDRNYYLINFDLDGGHGTAPVYARYETSFAVATPERSGYVFAGWDLIAADDISVPMETTETGDPIAEQLPGTIPAGNRTYRALWTTIDTTYTIVYWHENADDAGYSYWGQTTKSAKSGAKVSGVDDISSDITTKTIDGNSIDEKRFFTYNDGRTDKNVVVEGDGSTIVNVYYDRKVYTLKFYYAASTVNDLDTSTNDHNWIYVIGGSTYFFGGLDSGSMSGSLDNDIDLMSRYMQERWGQRGTVTEIPRLNAKGMARNYVQGEELATVDTDYKYHYISFKAKYGADISNMWPCDVFKAVTRENPTNTNGWSGDQAFVSAWNGEYNVYYTRHNSNQTIKGNYQKLDYKLLWESSDPTDMTVAYLCFWENGTNVTWNVPELWYYRQWVPVLDDEDISDDTIQVYNGITYKLQEQYATCDDSDLNGQTQVALEGFSGNEKNDLSDSEVKTVLANQGYTEEDLKTNYQSWYVVDFYYARNNYSLNYHNYGTMLTAQNKSVPYETPLSKDSYFFVPEYPDSLEKGVYEFKGWYTSPGFYEGTEFWDEDGTYVGGNSFKTEGSAPTMPAADVTLYAKWALITHEVNFYYTYDDMMDAAVGITVSQYRSEPAIEHGKVITGGVDVPTYPQDEGAETPRYAFAGWFYMDNGVKTAFDPNEMSIQQDLELFAEWKTSITTTYEIHYIKAELSASGEYVPVTDADGNYIEVAQPTKGHTFTGSTKTFTAKGGDDLTVSGEDAELIWLPHTNSHSILMKEPIVVDGAAATPEDNIFYFKYIAKDSVKYTVRYLDAATGLPMFTFEDGKQEKIYEVRDSVVFELPLYKEGYTSGPICKTLVLSANESENVITFLYTKNAEGTEEKNHYVIHHMLQNLDEITFSEHELTTGTGEIGASIPVTPLTISGFEYVSEITVGSGSNAVNYKSDTEGTISNSVVVELNLYYKRLKYPYIIKHMLYDSNDTLMEDGLLQAGDINKIQGDAFYEMEITGNALNIDGFELVGTQTSKSIEIAIETKPENAAETWEPKLNLIKFYYKPMELEIQYIPVCPEAEAAKIDMTKWLTLQLERPTDLMTEDEEDHYIVKGSSPIQPDHFHFKGWFTDPEGNDLVTTGVEEKRLTPVIRPADAISKDYSFRYYAIFEPIKEDLKITKTGTGLDQNDTFLFRVTGTNVLGQTVDLTVSIQGAGSVMIEDLYCSDENGYTVTELTNWSWTYAASGDTVQKAFIKHDDDKTLYECTFTNQAVSVDWLHGEAVNENQFS